MKLETALTQPPPPPTLPPPPSFTPPSTSNNNNSPSKKTTSYLKTQNTLNARNAELDSLRRRGLAKIFNKHFTTVATKIQQERAAAEIALAELERRKVELAANPKCFELSTGMTLTQLDKLYMELKKRKDDVQKKQRETQELYRRYVSQYSGENGRGGGGGDGDGKLAHINEYSPDEIVWQSDLLLFKATEKNQATKDADVEKMALEYNAVNDDEDNNNDDDELQRSTTPRMNIHENHPFSTYNESPPLLSSEERPNTKSVKGIQKPTTPMSKGSTTNSGSNNNNMTKTLLVASSPTPTSPTLSFSTEPTAISPTPAPQDKQQKAANNDVISETSDSLLGKVTTIHKISSFVSDESSSTMSGLTTIDGATVVEAEWRLTEFLKVETDNIRKMFEEQAELDVGADSRLAVLNDGSSLNNDGLSKTSQPSIIVGEVSQAAKEAEEMVRQMEAATAWMKDPTLLDSDSDDDDEEDDDDEDLDDDDEYENGEKIKRTTDLDWRCFWSEDHEREYYYNTETGQTCWSKPNEVEIDYSSMKKSQAYKAEHDDDDDDDDDDATSCSVITFNIDDDNDSVTVKDYTSSRRRLVEHQIINPSEYTNEEMIDVFRPDNDNISVSSRGSMKQSSKVLQYRRKRARMRRMKRRLKIGSALIVVASVTSYIYRDQIKTLLADITSPVHVQKHVLTEHVHGGDDLSTNDELIPPVPVQTHVFTEDVHSGDDLSKNDEPIPRTILVVQEKEEEIMLHQVRSIAKEDDQVQDNGMVEKQPENDPIMETDSLSIINPVIDFLTDVTLSPDKDQSTAIEEIPEGSNVKEEDLINEESVNSENNEVAILDDNAKVKDNAHSISTSSGTQIATRPWYCGIPFAYAPSRQCFRLATTKPLYNCKSLTDSMME